MKRRISITVSEELLESFRSYCRANGMKLSSRIEIMLRDALASELREEGARMQEREAKV